MCGVPGDVLVFSIPRFFASLRLLELSVVWRARSTAVASSSSIKLNPCAASQTIDGCWAKVDAHKSTSSEGEIPILDWVRRSRCVRNKVQLLEPQWTTCHLVVLRREQDAPHIQWKTGLCRFLKFVTFPVCDGLCLESVSWQMTVK